MFVDVVNGDLRTRKLLLSKFLRPFFAYFFLVEPKCVGIEGTKEDDDPDEHNDRRG